MAILKPDEIREMSVSNMQERIKELQKELVREKGAIAGGGAASNPGKMKEIRKTIARIKTVIKEKEV